MKPPSPPSAVWINEQRPFGNVPEGPLFYLSDLLFHALRDAVDSLTEPFYGNIPPLHPNNYRFPNDVVDAVEKAIQRRNSTFSAFVIASVRAALEDINQKDE